MIFILTIHTYKRARGLIFQTYRIMRYTCIFCCLFLQLLQFNGSFLTGQIYRQEGKVSQVAITVDSRRKSTTTLCSFLFKVCSFKQISFIMIPSSYKRKLNIVLIKIKECSYREGRTSFENSFHRIIALVENIITILSLIRFVKKLSKRIN